MKYNFIFSFISKFLITCRSNKLIMRNYKHC